MSDTESIKRSGTKMALATIASRITGFIRTWAMAFALGSGTIASAYSISNGMPAFICDLIMGGVLGAAFLPVYMQAKSAASKNTSSQYASAMLNWTIIILGIASILCAVLAPQVILTQTFTVAADNEVYERAVWFFRIFSLQILFYGISGILSGLLNAERIYGLPSLAPVANNIITTASFLYYAFNAEANPETSLMILAIGTTAGVVMQAIIQLPIAIANGFKWSPILKFQDGLLKETIKMSSATMIYIIGALISVSARNAFALSTGEEGPSILSYAWTWFQLPYGIVAVSVATTIFTEMGDTVSKHDKEGFLKAFSSGLKWTILFMMPLTALMALLAPYVSSVFQFGAFTSDDVDSVATILRLWCISLPLYAVIMFYYKTYAAIHKMFQFAIPMLIMNIVQCFIYAIAVNALGITGITIADFIYYAVSVIILTIMLPYAIDMKQESTSTQYQRNTLITVIKICFATIILIAVSMLAIHLLSQILHNDTISNLIMIFIVGIIGLLTYACAVIAMKIQK